MRKREPSVWMPRHLAWGTGRLELTFAAMSMTFYKGTSGLKLQFIFFPLILFVLFFIFFEGYVEMRTSTGWQADLWDPPYAYKICLLVFRFTPLILLHGMWEEEVESGILGFLLWLFLDRVSLGQVDAWLSETFSRKTTHPLKIFVLLSVVCSGIT